jgi:hypothetical protein
MRPHLDCDDQPLRWNLIAPTIGYLPGFVNTSRAVQLRVFDHGRVVRHESGQLAFFCDPYREQAPRGEVQAIASKYGMSVDYYGDGCWVPGRTVSIVLRVIDAERAYAHFAVYGAWRSFNVTFQVNQPKRFMPPGTDMHALRGNAAKRCERRIAHALSPDRYY